MKTEKAMVWACVLNGLFAVLELIGGLLTGSVAIASDAVHDLGDALSIGVSCVLERISKRTADNRYSYGYGRYSLLGGGLTSLLLLLGSCAVVYQAVCRLVQPEEIHYEGMMILAVIGTVMNVGAALLTRGDKSVNQKAVNLHMMEDALGWVAVLVGALVMRWTDWRWIDPLLSMGVSVYILVHAIANLKEVLSVFLESTPVDVDAAALKEQLNGIDGVADIHHLHVRSLDGRHHSAELHVVTDSSISAVKEAVRHVLSQHGIHHATIETESVGEDCHHRECHMEPIARHSHHHGHHH